jgi:hypothetical protein
LLAKNVNDDAGILDACVALGFFASKLAPAVGECRASVFLLEDPHTHAPVCRLSLREIALWMVFSCSNWSMG